MVIGRRRGVGGFARLVSERLHQLWIEGARQALVFQLPPFFRGPFAPLMQEYYDGTFE